MVMLLVVEVLQRTVVTATDADAGPGFAVTFIPGHPPQNPVAAFVCKAARQQHGIEAQGLLVGSDVM